VLDDANQGKSTARAKSAARMLARLGPNDASVSTGQHALQSGYEPLSSILYLPSSFLTIFADILAGWSQSVGSSSTSAVGSNSIVVSGIFNSAEIV